MNPSAQSGFVDELERTTLQIDADISAHAGSQLQHALQRVPGVLVASVDAATARAIVAHDPAVPVATLVAVASDAGIRSTIVQQKPAPAAGADVAPPAERVSSRRFLLFVVAPLCALLCVEAIIPSLAKNRYLTPVLLSFVWAFVVARATLNRRTSRRGRR